MKRHHRYGPWKRTAFHVGNVMRRDCIWCGASQATPTHRDPAIRADQLKMIEDEGRLRGLRTPSRYESCPVSPRIRALRRKHDGPPRRRKGATPKRWTGILQPDEGYEVLNNRVPKWAGVGEGQMPIKVRVTITTLPARRRKGGRG